VLLRGLRASSNSFYKEYGCLFVAGRVWLPSFICVCCWLFWGPLPCRVEATQGTDTGTPCLLHSYDKWSEVSHCSCSSDNIFLSILWTQKLKMISFFSFSWFFRNSLTGLPEEIKKFKVNFADIYFCFATATWEMEVMRNVKRYTPKRHTRNITWRRYITINVWKTRPLSRSKKLLRLSELKSIFFSGFVCVMALFFHDSYESNVFLFTADCASINGKCVPLNEYCPNGECHLQSCPGYQEKCCCPV